MKKFQTLDGYQVYRIKKNKKFFFLADRLNYKMEINKLSDTLDDLKFDSVVFLFGIDTGEYIQELKKLLCVKNKVFIFEPNKAIFHKYNPVIPENIELVLYKEETVKKIFSDNIYYKNINNIYFHAFGNYRKIYKKEYDCLIEHLDTTLINVSSQVGLAKRFKKVFIQNMIANMEILNKSTPIDHYMFTNINVPAVIISGGPSLDKNIQEMLNQKDKLKKCFIITGSRTVGALIKNQIMPDMIVSVDPVDANYDMMKDYLDLEVPLVFYEYSNRYLIRDYKGDKIYIPLLFSHTMESLKKLKSIYCGGSVAHACIDIANMLGCSPILFVGQDLAYTYQKHHADIATFDYDKAFHYSSDLTIKDIHDKPINTTCTLDYYRKRLEKYIDVYHKNERIKFINCSYGAKIKGAPHKELSQVFKQRIFYNQKKNCAPNQDIMIDSRKTIDSILEFIDHHMAKANQGLEICKNIILENQQKSLVDLTEEDMDLQRILYILQIVNEFENAKKSRYLGGYFTQFLFEMKQNIFQMYAKDYKKLTSDLQHQARAFQIYFDKMVEMLQEVRENVVTTVIEFYDQPIINENRKGRDWYGK